MIIVLPGQSSGYKRDNKVLDDYVQKEEHRDELPGLIELFSEISLSFH